MAKRALALVGDIGGTHARFALIEAGEPPGSYFAAESLPSKEFPTILAAVRRYLALKTPDRQPEEAALAVAGPIRNGEVAFTNLGWRVSEAELRSEGGFKAVRLLNDFAATALGLPVLGPGDLTVLGPNLAPPGAETLAVLGPGTGFGVGALVRSQDREIVVAGEGGHIGFAPTTPLEVEILKVLIARFGRVSVERLLSGPGLVEIYAALGVIEGRPSAAIDPAAITRAALEGEPRARRTVELFSAALGSTAGDFALSFGALGGVYIAGGVALTLCDFLKNGAFRERFEDKGRLSSFTQAIPTFLITHASPNLLGAVRALPSRAAEAERRPAP